MQYITTAALFLALLAACSDAGGEAADASAGLVDATTRDAAPLDAAPVDAEVPDAQVPDATPDAALPTCEVGAILCDTTCVDPETDGDRCGATTCDDGIACDDGLQCDGAGACEAFVCQAGPFATSCDPLTQTGCQAGEKCARIVESEDPFLSRTTCVPDGIVQIGGGCSSCASLPSYDNCAAGSSCADGVCRSICGIGPPDTCRAPGQAIDEGEHCTLDGTFPDAIGLCMPACDPMVDTVASGVATNADCGAGKGCYLNASLGHATCNSVPPGPDTFTQNQDCHGPGSGGCFLSGCASGFAPILNNKPVDADGTVCTRYCSPVVTHATAQAGAEGANGDCTSAALSLLGGTNGETSEHQCRFVQSFYSNTEQVSADIGMCVPVTLIAGGTWTDCKILDWDGIKAAWNGGFASGGLTAANQAFDDHCLVDPGDPQQGYKDICQGFFSLRGCLSLQEKEDGLLP